jgi:uncharacterized membrane protein YfcA
LICRRTICNTLKILCPLLPFPTMTVFFIAGFIFLLAGFVQGLTGFGSALVAIPLLSLIIEIKTAVPLCMLNGLIITSYLAFKLRHHLNRDKISPLLIGSLPGIAVGVSLLKHVDASYIRYGIGVLLIIYSLFNLIFSPRPLNPGKTWGYLAGFLTGTIGAAFSAGGPPAIIYTTLTSWKKDEIKATLTGFFATTGLITVIVHAASGITTLTTVKIFAVTAPFVLIGTTLGSLVSGRIKRKTYLKLIYCFLIVMGIMMMLT